jgi:hypothetical protein
MTGLKVHHPTSGLWPQRPAGSPTCAGLGGPGLTRDAACKRLTSWIQPTRPGPVGLRTDRSCRGAPGAGYRPGLPRTHGPGPTRSLGLRPCRQPYLPAAPRDHVTDRPARDRVVGQAWAPPMEGRAVVVLVELLAAAGCAVGPGRWAVVRVRAAGLCSRLLQPALTTFAQRRHARHPSMDGVRRSLRHGPVTLSSDTEPITASSQARSAKQPHLSFTPGTVARQAAGRRRERRSC